MKNPPEKPPVADGMPGHLNDADAMQLSSGIAAFEAKEFRRAWQLLQPLAENGNADALYRCGIMTQNGLGVVANLPAAAQMIREAADQDFALAQHSLGVMHVFGEGVEANASEAIRLLELAGEAGLVGAWSTLGMIYNEGQGVEPDKDRARAYYQKAGFDPDEIM